MKKLILLVGPPGSGKSTTALGYASLGYKCINQDEQGKDGHLRAFNAILDLGVDNIVVDRMNFSLEQRNRYLAPAKAKGYTTKIIVFHESYETCFNRCIARTGHPTIKNGATAKKALRTFFTKYERVGDDEGTIIARLYPAGAKQQAIVVDLDGTLCNIDHRLHYLRGSGKKDWKSFFEGIKDDTVNAWCANLIQAFQECSTNFFTDIIFCSGRPDDYRDATDTWLSKNNIFYRHLFMRPGGDFRSDDIVKEQILDFEILTRYNIMFWVDDRKQVVDKIRSRGITVLQCAPGEF